MRARQGKERALYVYESMKYEMAREVPEILLGHYVITTGEWMLDDPILLENVDITVVGKYNCDKNDRIP